MNINTSYMLWPALYRLQLHVKQLDFSQCFTQASQLNHICNPAGILMQPKIVVVPIKFHAAFGIHQLGNWKCVLLYAICILRSVHSSFILLKLLFLFFFNTKVCIFAASPFKLCLARMAASYTPLINCRCFSNVTYTVLKNQASDDKFEQFIMSRVLLGIYFLLGWVSNESCFFCIYFMTFIIYNCCF